MHFYIEVKLCCILDPEDAFGEVYLGDDECWWWTVADIFIVNLPKLNEFRGGICNGSLFAPMA